MCPPLSSLVSGVTKPTHRVGWLWSACWLLASSLLPSPADAVEVPVPVRVDRVRLAEIPPGKVFVGTVEAARRSIVGSAVAGRIDKVFVEEGDFVDPVPRRNGRLVQLRENTARIQLAAAAANLEVTKQQLAELVAGPREEEVRRLQAEAEGAKAVREFAAKNFERLADLFDRDAAAKGNLEQALSTRIAAEQRYIAALAEHQAALAGTRKEQLSQAQARVAVAREEMNRLQDLLDKHTIHAPFRGYVVRRMAEKGAWLQVGDPIAEVMELDPVEVRVGVPEEYIAWVRKDADVKIEIAALGSERSVVDGRVFRIVPNADVRSRAFPVRIRVANPSLQGLPALKPGMLARVRLAVGKSTKSLLVRKDALVFDTDDPIVLFALPASGESGQVERVTVTVGETDDQWVAVIPQDGRLQDGMRVVVEGNERLSAGQQVVILAD